MRESVNPMFAVTFSPDGKRIVAVNASGRVFVWDANVDANSSAETRRPLAFVSTAICNDDHCFKTRGSAVSGNLKLFVWATFIYGPRCN